MDKDELLYFLNKNCNTKWTMEDLFERKNYCYLSDDNCNHGRTQCNDECRQQLCNECKKTFRNYVFRILDDSNLQTCSVCIEKFLDRFNYDCYCHPEHLKKQFLQYQKCSTCKFSF